MRNGSFKTAHCPVKRASVFSNFFARIINVIVRQVNGILKIHPKRHFSSSSTLVPVTARTAQLALRLPRFMGHPFLVSIISFSARLSA